MPNIFPLLNHWASSPAMSEYIDIEKFIDTNTFRTKTGQLGVMLSIQGIDYESVLDVQLDMLTGRLESAFQMFDTGTRVYQYFFKSTRPTIPHRHYANNVSTTIINLRIEDLERRADDLYETRTYLAVLMDMSAEKMDQSGIAKLLSGFSAKSTIAISLEAQEHTRTKLLQQVNTFIAAVTDFADVNMLDQRGAYSVYRYLLNPNPAIRQMPMVDGAAEAPAFFAADSSLQVHETHLELDDYFVKVLSLKALPYKTQPNALKSLFLVPGNYHITSTWVAESHETTRKHSEGIIGFNEGTKSRATLTPKRQIGPGRVSKSKDAISDLLENVQVDIATKGLHFGHYSLTVVVYERDPEALERLVDRFITAGQTVSITLMKESEFANLAYLATFPGSHRYNLRLKRISESNHSDLSFFYTIDTGNKINAHLNDEYLALFTTRNNEPYYFNMHCGEVGHTSIIGPTSQGKSFLLNYLVGQASKYNPFVTIIDLGGSYKFVTQLLGGNYNNFSQSDRNFRLNPFRLEKTPGNLDFLTTLVCSLIEQAGFTLEDKMKNEVFHKITDLYEMKDASTRTLTVLSRMLPEVLADKLTRWIGDGQYGYIFDNPDGEDRLTMSRFQTFNFEGFDEKSDFLQPLLFYILHRTTENITAKEHLDALKLFILDEAFVFFKHRSIVEYLNKGLLTWRKHNAAVVFATQAVDHLAKTSIMEDVVNSCATNIFLANSKVDAKTYAETFKMSPATAELIRPLVPRREFLCLTDSDPKRRGGSSKIAKVLRLDVSPRERWLYSNSAPENVRRNKALKMFNNDLNKALDYLVANPDDSVSA